MIKIIGPDCLVFGVDDVAACCQYLTDYGLTPVGVSALGGRFEALDGTAIEVRHRDDAALPAPLKTGAMLRETVYGVTDAAQLDAIAAELSKDRPVQRDAQGRVQALDDMGFALTFQVTVRRTLSLPAERINAPGGPQRAPNELGVTPELAARPRSLSHVVLFVPDAVKAEAFYTRLGFVTTDRFTNVGPFMRPAGTLDHHTLFMIHTPPHMQGVEHFTFHMGGPTEVMQAGTRFVAKGYESFWGPGRHMLGSNWFWYFNSPMGCHVEYDADMDLHDSSWVARDSPSGPDYAQLFLFKSAPKWMPGGSPH